MSRTSKDQRSFANALPSSDVPKGPGNISGKSVRTVACQLLDMIGVFVIFWYRHQDAPARDVDHRAALPKHHLHVRRYPASRRACAGLAMRERFQTLSPYAAIGRTSAVGRCL